MVRITVITAGLVFLAALVAGWVLSRLLSPPVAALDPAMEQFEQDADHFAFQAVRGTREVQNALGLLRPHGAAASSSL